jgi:hypothetical protein
MKLAILHHNRLTTLRIHMQMKNDNTINTKIIAFLFPSEFTQSQPPQPAALPGIFLASPSKMREKEKEQ